MAAWSFSRGPIASGSKVARWASIGPFQRSKLAVSTAFEFAELGTSTVGNLPVAKLEPSKRA
jgi:hypothetical protein